MMLVDADIIIEVLHQSDQAQRFLLAQPTAELAVHAAVCAEVLSGARNRRELQIIDRVLDQFLVVAPSEADGMTSLQLLRVHRLGGGIGWMDCLIASTALRLQATLATRNDRHFRLVHGLAIVRPY